ncbi:hypothetical protein D3C71_1465890 [compost metagenome]
MPCFSSLDSSSLNRSAVFIENCVISMTPTPPLSILAYTVSSLTSSRLILKVNGCDEPDRWTTSVAVLPFGPRILATASFRSSPCKDSPFTETITSFA